jgi:predicted RNase H-like HicB family nuclease
MTSEYAVCLEATPTGFSAYVPDLPGCIAGATSREETERLIREAIEIHLDGMRDDGDAIPAPTTIAEMIAVTVR